MRTEKAIMTPRREFLSNALGIALVSALSWPIRAHQARSMHRQSDRLASFITLIEQILSCFLWHAVTTIGPPILVRVGFRLV